MTEKILVSMCAVVMLIFASAVVQASKITDCTDSDEGSYYKKGTMVAHYTTDDSCSTNGYICFYKQDDPACFMNGEWNGEHMKFVDEYFCENGKVRVVSYECPYGCLDGACLTEDAYENLEEELVLGSSKDTSPIILKVGESVTLEGKSKLITLENASLQGFSYEDLWCTHKSNGRRNVTKWDCTAMKKSTSNVFFYENNNQVPSVSNSITIQVVDDILDADSIRDIHDEDVTMNIDSQLNPVALDSVDESVGDESFSEEIGYYEEERQSDSFLMRLIFQRVLHTIIPTLLML